jgi:hypothetical protein
MGSGPCEFHVVVPATKPVHMLTWTEGEARAIAQERLDRALEWFRSLGTEATGEIGDPHPLLAIRDAMIASEFDEIIFSTLPAGASRWLKQDMISRARRMFGLPVRHVVAQRARATG